MKLRNFISHDSLGRIGTWAISLATAAALLCVAGCMLGGPGNGRVEHGGEAQTENVGVPIGAAKSVRVHLKIGAGKLTVAGGSSQLMNGKIIYNIPDWKPDVSYSISNGTGMLMVMQPDDSSSAVGDVNYQWDLKLNNAIPLDMNIEMGAGKSELNFAGMTLRSLDIETGAGKSTIDLSGPWKQGAHVTIQGGVGEVDLKLPREVGVRAMVEGALGSVDAPGFQKNGSDYVNDAYGKSPITIDVSISGGIGHVTLSLAGSRAIV